MGFLRFPAIPLYGSDYRANGQSVLAGKLKVPGIVGRHSHYRSRAVSGQHVVGHVDGHLFVVEPIARAGSNEHAGLFPLGGKAVDFRRGPGLLDVRLYFRALAL